MKGWLDVLTIGLMFVGVVVLPSGALGATRAHLKWQEVSEDLSLLDPLILTQLKKTICFLVEDQGVPHAALIVRAPSGEFRGAVGSQTPMRLHVDFYEGRHSDVFAIYPIIYDDPADPFFKETWLSPYGKSIGPPDPLAEGSRERLRLLLTQGYVRTLVIDENDRLTMVRTIRYTDAQKARFRRLADRLDAYAGETITVETYIEGLRDYLNAVPAAELRSEFVALLKER